MKRCFIYAAGVCTTDDISLYGRIKHNDDDLVICADGGYDTITAAGEIPDAVIGDMDSVRRQIPKEIKRVYYPKSKDKTDLHLCVDYALENGCGEIILLGAMGGRIDHTLANMILLRYIEESGADGMILTANTSVFVTSDKIKIPKGNFRYVSLIPMTEKAEGVTTKGLRYSLTNYTLNQIDNLGVSNVFTGDIAEISVTKGTLFIICEM